MMTARCSPLCRVRCLCPVETVQQLGPLQGLDTYHQACGQSLPSPHITPRWECGQSLPSPHTTPDGYAPWQSCLGCEEAGMCRPEACLRVGATGRAGGLLARGACCAASFPKCCPALSAWRTQCQDFACATRAQARVKAVEEQCAQTAKLNAQVRARWLPGGSPDLWEGPKQGQQCCCHQWCSCCCCRPPQFFMFSYRWWEGGGCCCWPWCKRG